MQALWILRHAGRKLHHLKFFGGIIHAYLFSFDQLFVLGLFTAAVAGLFSHKIIIIRLHQPLPVGKLILAYPFLFVFDVVTLVGLHWGLNAVLTSVRILSTLVAFIIISCSAAFASLYFEGNAELNWGRSVEVFIFS